MTNFGARGAEPIIIATPAKPKTSWWTVDESGDRFKASLREAQHRMASQLSCKLPDLSHLADMRRNGR